jgi:signal transduction histidine kinase/DNA-binding response OmpR family regulator
MASHADQSEIEDSRKKIAVLERRLARSEQARAEAEALVEERGRFLAQHNEQFLRTLLDSLDQGIAVFDPRLKLASCNRAFLTLADKCPAPIRIGQFSLVSEAEALNLESVFRRTSDGGREYCAPGETTAMPGTYDYLLVDGRSLEVSVIELGARGFVKSYADVSAYLATQRQLEDAHRVAVAADQTKSRFLAMMSHDIRTPMNAMLAMLELLSITNLEPKQARQVALAQSSGEQLLFLLADIIEVARADGWALELKPKPIRIADFAALVCDAWKPLAQAKGLQLEHQLADDLPTTLAADPTRLRQLFDNLISNAIKYTQKGRVDVALSRLDAEEQSWLQVEVRDTGRGISKDLQSGLFVDTQRIENPLEPVEEGTGLGLGICRRIIMGMAGTIGAKSEQGAGSTFWFRIPLVLAEESEARKPAAIASVPLPVLAAKGRAPHILVAEDVEANRIVMSAMLDELGVSYDFAEDGKIAVSLFSAALHDAVLMDVSMPSMDGAQATRLIRALENGTHATNRTPIIAVTAFVGREEKAALLDAGVDAIVEKPVRLAQLRQALLNALYDAPPATRVERVRGKQAPIPSFMSASVVDEAMLLGQLDLLPPEKRAALTETIIADLAAWHARFCDARASNDAPEMSRTCHALTGICSGFGAGPLLASLSELRAFDPAQAANRMSTHMQLFEATLEALQNVGQ